MSYSTGDTPICCSTIKSSWGPEGLVRLLSTGPLEESLSLAAAVLLPEPLRHLEQVPLLTKKLAEITSLGGSNLWTGGRGLFRTQEFHQGSKLLVFRANLRVWRVGVVFKDVLSCSMFFMLDGVFWVFVRIFPPPFTQKERRSWNWWRSSQSKRVSVPAQKLIINEKCKSLETFQGVKLWVRGTLTPNPLLRDTTRMLKWGNPVTRNLILNSQSHIPSYLPNPISFATPRNENPSSWLYPKYYPVSSF